MHVSCCTFVLLLGIEGKKGRKKTWESRLGTAFGLLSPFFPLSLPCAEALWPASPCAVLSLTEHAFCSACLVGQLPVNQARKSDQAANHFSEKSGCPSNSCPQIWFWLWKPVVIRSRMTRLKTVFVKIGDFVTCKGSHTGIPGVYQGFRKGVGR